MISNEPICLIFAVLSLSGKVIPFMDINVLICILLRICMDLEGPIFLTDMNLSRPYLGNKSYLPAPLLFGEVSAAKSR